MYIRTQQEALDAVAALLALSERREQIIQSTVAIMKCVESEPRHFLADCQALLLEDGLEGLKRKRREIFDQLHEQEVVAVLDPEEDREVETIASALDAVRFAELLLRVFPIFSDRFQPWEIARALLSREASIQEEVLTALRFRNNAATYGAAEARVESILRSCIPEWHRRVPEIRRACVAVLPNPDEAERIFCAVVTSDDSALSLLRKLDRDPMGAVADLRRLHELTSALRRIEEAA